MQVPARKLVPRVIGPYTVVKVVSPVAVQLRLPNSFHRVHPVFHVSKIELVFHTTNALPATSLIFPPPPLIIEGAQAFKVKGIVDSWRRGCDFGTWLIWEGYGPEERYWVSVIFMDTLTQLMLLCNQPCWSLFLTCLLFTKCCS